jgi:murein DD-endopeptidase MepM/ murein hydrolase activator NlpD
MSALCRCLTAWRANFDRRRRFGVAYAARMAESDRAAQTIPGEGGATMTASWVRTAAAAASVLALQACTMPHSEYPPSADYQTPAALQSPKPQYPVNQDQPPPMQSADPHDPVASPTPPVSAQPLPPPAPPSGPTAYFGPRLTYAVASTQPLELWQAAHHRRAHERARTRVDARGRLEAAGEAKSVKIRKGDTLRSLAKRYGTTPRALMAANGIKHPGDLAVGAPITVPGAPAALTRRERRAEAAAETHEVRAPKTYRAHRGDTIYSIGRRFKISPRTIEALNGFTQKTHLTTGELVRLPGSEVDVATERTPPRPPRQEHIPPASSSEAASSMAEPDHPIPYDELPGHLEGPTASYAPVPSVVGQPSERPIVPPVAQPQPLGPPDASVLSAGRGRFVWPVRGTVFSGFGPKAGGQRSDGIDIAAPLGTPVMAAATGDVVYAGALPELGNLVLVKHQDGWITAYAHLSKTEVRIKDHVAQGQEVGQAGESGSAAQSEVYFEIRYAPTPRDKARPVDPALLLASQ